MKKIYAAANVPEAYIVRDLLLHAGIAARILNEHAMSAMGEVPLGSAYPQIWIVQDHQEQHARSVLREYEQRANASGPRPCERCAEENPAGFELCWNCGVTLPVA